MIRVAAAEMPEHAWHISAADPHNAATVALEPAGAAGHYDVASISAGSQWQPHLIEGTCPSIKGQLHSASNTKLPSPL